MLHKHTPKILACLAAATAFLYACLAFATDPAPAAAVTAAPVIQQEWWQVLIVYLMQAFIAIFVPVLSMLVYTLAKKWKLNIELDTVDKIISKAVGFAEQKALGLLKQGKPKTSSADKLNWALGMATDLAKKYGLPKKATEKLKDLIEAKLGEKAMNGASAAPAGSTG